MHCGNARRSGSGAGRRSTAAQARTPRGVRLAGPASGERRPLEAYIHRCYALAYGADLRDFMPELFGVVGRSGELQGVGGARFATLVEPFFLEAYLDAPVEALLARALRRPVDRASLVEVGNLACLSRGGGRWLVTLMAAWLEGRGATWAVFTAARPVRDLFDRMGVPLIDLGPARASRLGAAAQVWGRYYDCGPRVMAVRIARVREHGLDYASWLTDLASYAYLSGLGDAPAGEVA